MTLAAPQPAAAPPRTPWRHRRVPTRTPVSTASLRHRSRRELSAPRTSAPSPTTPTPLATPQTSPPRRVIQRKHRRRDTPGRSSAPWLLGRAAVGRVQPDCASVASRLRSPATWSAPCVTPAGPPRCRHPPGQFQSLTSISAGSGSGGGAAFFCRSRSRRLSRLDPLPHRCRASKFREPCRATRRPTARAWRTHPGSSGSLA